jgi:hypothetical protein
MYTQLQKTVCGVYCWSVVVSFFLFALQLSSGGCGIACGGFGSVAAADGDSAFMAWR